MAAGEIVLFTIAHTSSSTSMPGYPLKRKYIQTAQTRYPVFPTSFSIYDTKLYWFPYEGIEPSQENYIEYLPSSSATYSPPTRKRAPIIGRPNASKKKYPLFAAGSNIFYANTIFVATEYYFNWTDAKFSKFNNPYNTNKVNKWKKFNDTNDEWAQYWFHPGEKKFYSLDNSDSVLELYEPGDAEQDKWGLFSGDTLDIDLTSFTIANIDELVSQGLTQDAATATIQALDDFVIKSNFSEDSEIEYTSNTLGNEISHSNLLSNAISPVTATVKSPGTSQGSSVRSTGISNPPMMVQEYRSPLDGRQVRDIFTFDFSPNNISYTNIGSQWTEIDRVANSPIVDFKNFKHMKINFEFVVSDTSGGISSLYSSCEQQLFKLRKMAARPEFIRFINFDILFNKFLIYPQLLLNGNNTSFAIVDMSINSVQRTRADSNTGYSGEISRATVNMTVQEVATSGPDLIIMPRIVAAPLNPGKPKEENDPETCVEKLTSTDGVIGKAATLKVCGSSGSYGSTKVTDLQNLDN